VVAECTLEAANAANAAAAAAAGRVSAGVSVRVAVVVRGVVPPVVRAELVRLQPRPAASGTRPLRLGQDTAGRGR
jgi:hypothetical protein